MILRLPRSTRTDTLFPYTTRFRSDCVQESFVRLVGSMAQRTLPAPAAYLQRIARNLLYDRSKRMEVRLAQFHVPIGEGCEPTIEASQQDRKSTRLNSSH